MDARGVRHEKIMEATDAVGWRVDMLIEAQPYLDRWVSTAVAGHLGSHSSHLQRLVTCGNGELCALKDLIWHVRHRPSPWVAIATMGWLKVSASLGS